MKSAAFRSVVLTLSLCTNSLSMADESLRGNAGAASNDFTIISRDVIVKNGDSFKSIARQQLGKAGLAPLLAAYNNMSVFTSLKTGDIVRIPIHVPPRRESAEVVYVKGTVTAKRRIESASGSGIDTPMGRPVLNVTQRGITEKDIILTRNAYVFAGDVITTPNNGYVSIAFTSEFVINLQPDTVATIERLMCLETDDSCIVEITTERGQVNSDVEARNQQPLEFRINTPYASAAVRGTVFDMNAADTVLVGVTEGAVDVTAQGESVALDTGFGLTVSNGEIPGEPIELIPAPVFKRVPPRIALGDTVEWWSFIDAENYQVRLTTDEAANETLGQLDIPGDDIGLALRDALTEPVDSGFYFLSVRAIDTNGLIGYPSNTQVTLADIDSDIATVSTSVVRDENEFIITVDEEGRPANAIGYEIQVSTDEAFTEPLSLDVNEQGIVVFQIDSDQVFTRARVLIDPFTVSAFGEVNSN